MKIAHMYTNIMYEFQNSTCKTVGEKPWTKLCPQTEGRMDSHGDSSISPSTWLCVLGGKGIKSLQTTISDLLKMVESSPNGWKTLRKGEISCYEQLLVPQCFQKTCTADM